MARETDPNHAVPEAVEEVAQGTRVEGRAAVTVADDEADAGPAFHAIRFCSRHDNRMSFGFWRCFLRKSEMPQRQHSQKHQTDEHER